MGKFERKRSLMTSVLRILAPLVFLLGLVRAQDVVIGVNVVNPMRASIADQNTVLSQLGAAHVHTIRCGISNDAKEIDYAKRAKAKGIRILPGVGAEYSPNAPTRPYQPYKFPAMWSGRPLSLCGSRAFESLLSEVVRCS